MLERRFYARHLKDDELVKFKNDMVFGTTDEGCHYENFASLARQINDKYNHPFAQCFLIKNLKYKYDQEVVPPEILCEMDSVKQKALLQGFNEE